MTQLSKAEKTWLAKYHAACSECVSEDELAALERKHEKVLKKIGLPGGEITLAHMFRIAGKSIPF